MLLLFVHNCKENVVRERQKYNINLIFSRKTLISNFHSNTDGLSQRKIERMNCPYYVRRFSSFSTVSRTCLSKKERIDSLQLFPLQKDFTIYPALQNLLKS